MKGLIHIYTGDGKGKTTAAVGLAVRAAGNGMRVLIIQFLKGRRTGELGPLEKLGIRVVRSENVVKFIPEMSPEELEACRAAQRECFGAALAGMELYDLIILDEAFGALQTGMIEKEELMGLIRNKREGLELVLTGRDAPGEFVELADYVSEIRSVRHPYEKGVQARRGIEY